MRLPQFGISCANLCNFRTLLWDCGWSPASNGPVNVLSVSKLDFFVNVSSDGTVLAFLSKLYLGDRVFMLAKGARRVSIDTFLGQRCLEICSDSMYMRMRTGVH